MMTRPVWVPVRRLPHISGLGLAELEWQQGLPERAARFLGASEGMLNEVGAALEPSDRAEYEISTRAVRKLLGDELYLQVWQAGRAMTIEQAIREATKVK